MPPRDFTQRAEDILDAMERTQRYTAGMAFEAFAADPRTVDAVIKVFVGWARSCVPTIFSNPP